MADPQVILPRRVIGKARTQNPYSSTASGQQIRPDTSIDMNRDSRSMRRGATAAATMRAHFESNSLASTAITQFVAMGSSGITVRSYDTATQEFSKEGTLVAEAVLASLHSTWDYSTGYSDKRALPALIESLLLESLLTGAACIELVLDKYRLPSRINVFGYDTIIFESKGNGEKYPTQKSSDGKVISLDLPTIFIGESMKSATRKYALPLLHSGLQRLYHYEQFLDESWRVVTQAGMTRLVVTLDLEKVTQSAPPEIRNDPAKMSSYLEEVRTVHERVLSGLEPQDALVCYNTAIINSISAGGEKADIAVLIESLSGLAASAMKSNPSALGLRIGGAQGIASAETLLAAKTAKLFQQPVQEVLSKALTLACRLYGVDVYSEVVFQEIDLRPSTELEAHAAIRQNRALELLAYGRVNDHEAQAMLGLGSLPPNAEELAGTMFLGDKRLDTLPVSVANARNKMLTPEGPTAGGGSSNEQAP